VTEKITLITPTGDRPLAFGLCCDWIFHQTKQPDQWIVVDDGREIMDAYYRGAKWMNYVRRDPRPDDPAHTLGRNIQAALPFVTGTKILMIEDDEYYAPTYIEEMARRLDQYQIVGIGRARYYNLQYQKWYRDENFWHASLAQTGFKVEFFDRIKHLFDDEIYIDVRIWETENLSRFSFGGKERVTDRGNGIVFDDGDDNPLYCGIKGLPGRKGMGIGHTDFPGLHPDPGNQMLKKWIPKDHEEYIKLIGG
jgi:hypothetical protein